MRKLHLFYLAFIVLISCEKKDTTPAWLVIDSVNFTTNEATEGPNSHGISDVWVYMDNKAIGVFEVPARIPILEEGEHDFIFYAGIKQNGISATRTRYPFYERYETTLNLVKDQEIELTPSFSYKSNVQFELLEDFEDVGLEFYKDPLSDTAIVNITKAEFPDIVQYGNNCGVVYLDEVDSLFKAFTSSDMDLPKNEEVYVEIDYMNDNSFILGVIADYPSSIVEQEPLVLMNPQDPSDMKWKKIYIYLKDNVSFEVNAIGYEIYLLSILDIENTTGSGVIYLDNIKVVSYE